MAGRQPLFRRHVTPFQRKIRWPQFTRTTRSASCRSLLGRESATLPGFLATRSISTRHFARWSARVIPLLERMAAVDGRVETACVVRRGTSPADGYQRLPQPQ
ncbi:MAG: hypothetical protein WA418_01610, partial [Bradyrhizobium sp.]